MLLHLVDLLDIDDGDGVFLAVHRSLLQGCEDLPPCHGRGVGSHCPPEGHVDLVLHGAQLEPLHIVRGIDRPLGVGEMAEAVLVPGQPLDSDFVEKAHDIGSDLSVEDLIGLGLVFEEKGEIEEHEFLFKPAHGACRPHVDVHNPELQPFKKVPLPRAELIVRKEGDLHFASGLLLNYLLEPLCPHMVGVLIAHRVSELQGNLSMGNAREPQGCKKYKRKDKGHSPLFHLLFSSFFIRVRHRFSGALSRDSSEHDSPEREFQGPPPPRRSLR